MNCYEAIDLMEDAICDCLTADARVGFAEHLEECAACRNYFGQLQVTVGALERMPRTPETNRRRSELIAEFKRQFAGNGGEH
jgi:predicted anti-sigma-YlaC factor YlaD